MRNKNWWCCGVQMGRHETNCIKCGKHRDYNIHQDVNKMLRGLSKWREENDKKL